MSDPIHIISLGAGIQSSAMALMAAEGSIQPMPTAAIFADTGAEPHGVYSWLAWLKLELPFPVYEVMEGDGLLENLKRSIERKEFAGAPFYTESDGQREGMLRRQCTREFKIQPIHRKMREMIGLAKGERAPKGVQIVSWQGISTDEIQRARSSTDHWLELRYPLLEQKMTRLHCMLYLEKRCSGTHAPQVQRSACTFCPYHSDAEWRGMDISSFDQAVQVDKLIRNGVRGTKQQLYLHRSCQPLESVDFRSASDFGQEDLFENECEGMCGL